MKTLYILCAVFTILLLGAPSALALTDADIDYFFKQGQKIDLKRTCINNGTWCSASTVCNSTVIVYPGTGETLNVPVNGHLFLNNSRETNQISFHNITWPNSSIPGLYEINRVCIDSGRAGSETFYAKITPTGDSRQFSFIGILAGVATVLFVLGLWKENFVFTAISGFIYLAAGVYVMIYGFNNITDLYTRGMATVAIGLGLYVTYSSIYEGLLEQ